jgi:hypothetical protein
MNYAVEMGSGVMVYIPSFIKIGSVIQKLKGEGGRLKTSHFINHLCFSLIFVQSASADTKGGIQVWLLVPLYS